jgi:hypothetical protein
VADLDVPARLIDILAKQMYGRAMRRRSLDTGWYDLTKEQRKAWLEDARAAVEPMYREIADDLERKMMATAAIDEAVKAFHRPGLTERQPVEEALTAAFHYALTTPTTRRTLEEAIKRLAQAGRELGTYGVGEAADRIGPGELALRQAGLAADKTPPMALGVAIGLLMAGDSEVEGALGAIHDDWLADQEAKAA